MTASELAFMALGLLFGAVGGAAIIVFFGTRLPRREIRVTVTRDALPRRSETLSQDAFVTSPAEPARGGPGDRRSNDRDARERHAAAAAAPDETAAAASSTPAAPPSPPVPSAPGTAPTPSRDRTIVPMGPGRPVSGATPLLAPISTPAWPVASGVAVETDRTVEGDGERELEHARHRRAWGSALERILRGEHRAMVEVLDRVAGPDSRQRREWELLIGGLADAMSEAAVRESVIDFPMGTAFWDGFTVAQCRRIVGALASMGYEYDGRDGWVDSRVPAYRDLSLALADVGLDPRRIRAWPNSSDIGLLFVGARPAPEELLAAAGPGYESEDVRDLVGDRAADLQDLWLAWDAVKPALLEEQITAS